MKEIVIRPKKIMSLVDLKEIWRYHDLFYIFVWRDIKVRYKQTILGILWVVLQPLVSMVIFTVLFGNLAKIPSGKLPYSLFVFIGLVFWTFFSTALSHTNDSLLANENIIKKVYFPKIILPLASVVTSFVDFTINAFLLLIFASVLGYFPNVGGIIIFPLAILMTTVTASGLGLFLSSLNVKYRDVRYILPYMVQILFYFTPVIYPLSIVSERNRYIMALNPMTSVVETMRVVFSGGEAVRGELLIISIASAFCIFIVGFFYFRKTEQFFADLL